ncbi:hypothetical protein AB0950_30035 [Streptomyces sp. NPDC007189]|uniref:hypothetical protein n=1 Tax=Streptomyces sp. NPDC007189 TaxID=3154315 RepID=UPI003452075E
MTRDTRGGQLARSHAELTQLKERHQQALSAPAAKDDELQRLRRRLSTISPTAPAGLVPLPRR